MILVTGGTGFIGQSLIRRLVEEGHAVRTLMRPSPISPKLPYGVPVEAAISSIDDERGLRAALVGVDTVYHLAGVNWAERNPDWHVTEVEGTRNLLETAHDAGVKRIVYLSHLGADRAAAYPFIKMKGIAEERIRHGPIPYTILRAGLVFGPHDNFTEPLAKLLALAPGLFPLPGDGLALIHPLWVEDLASALVWALDEEDSLNALFEVGGPEHLTIRSVAEQVMEAAGLRRTLINVRPSYLRVLVNSAAYLLPRLPISPTWLDYLANSRVTKLNTLPRVFGLMPERFSRRLDHLKDVDWRARILSDLAARPV
ncbi:MAG: NAD-dependent epimerase/dehydratase family protein [Chloroflexi bacterium]|nr:NAD-dependent epimerase/dehydratase family protein [Chloroflexota bacterium]